jgi:hypothetical protein
MKKQTRVEMMGLKFKILTRFQGRLMLLPFL